MRWCSFVGIVVTLLTPACSPSSAGDRSEINYSFDRCPLEIGVRLFKGFDDLQPVQLERQTPSLIDRIVLGSPDRKKVLVIGDARMLVNQGRVTPTNFQSLKQDDELDEAFDDTIEAPAMFAFYQVAEAGLTRYVTGLRFDHIGGCVVSTMFTLVGDWDREQVEAAMGDLSFVPRDKKR